MRVSTGRYILLLNPDTEAQPAALEALVRFMEDHPRVGAAGARIVNPDGSLQRSCFRAPRLSRELWRLLHLDVLYPYAEYRIRTWDQTQPRAVDTVLGACLLIRRTALDQVGQLDERFFIYSEEVDLCTRLRAAGWAVFWVPGAVVMHRGGESTRQVAAAMFLRLYQAKVLYFRKHQGQFGARVYKLILAVAATSRLALSPAAWLEGPTARERHLALAGAYGRLLRALPHM
jgi:GT2 family glycosyltransferase